MALGKSKSNVYSSTETQANQANVQGYDNQQSSTTLGDVGGGFASQTTVNVQAVDMGAIAGAMDLSKFSFEKATGMALENNRMVSEALGYAWDTAAETQSKALEIASGATGNSWRDKALIALAVAGMIYVFSRRKA